MVREYVLKQDGTPLPVFTALAPILTWAVNDNTKTECLGVERLEIEFENVNYTVT